MELADSVGDAETRVHALINVGTALNRSDPRGQALIDEARLAAIDEDLVEQACRAYTNLNWDRILRRQYEAAEQGLREGIAYAAEYEIEAFVSYMNGTLAWLLTERGRWDEAVEVAQRSMEGAALSSPVRMPALDALARVAARRGSLEQARGQAEVMWELAVPTGEVQRIAPAAAVGMEVGWLAGSVSDDAVRNARQALELALERRELRYAGELARWLTLAGHEVDAPTVDEPYLTELAGRWDEAARQWDELGAPYEAALCRALAGDVDAAVAQLEDLGAAGAVDRVRRLHP